MGNETGSTVIDFEGIIPDTASINGVWKTHSGKAFVLTDESVYSKSPTDSRDFMFCLPYDEVANYTVSNRRPGADYQQAMEMGVLALICLIGAYTADFLLEDWFLEMFLLSIFIGAAAIREAIRTKKSGELVTTVTLQCKNENEFTESFDETVANEIAATLTENIPLKNA